MTMRHLDQITGTTVPAGAFARPTARRPVPNYFAQLTVQVLFRHHETEKAWKLSATGDEAQSVWIPKRIVDVGRRDFGNFLVVTLTHQFAAANRLYTNFIDHSRFEGQIENLTRAMECARSSRAWINRSRTPGLHPNATA